MDATAGGRPVMRRRMINAYPSRSVGLFLAALPFVLLLLAYVGASAARLAVNPDDKLLPSIASITLL